MSEVAFQVLKVVVLVAVDDEAGDFTEFFIAGDVFIVDAEIEAKGMEFTKIIFLIDGGAKVEQCVMSH